MSVTLAEVDDYINPSQACINPLFTSEKTKQPNTDKAKSEGSQSNALPKRKMVKRRRRRVPLTLDQTQIRTHSINATISNTQTENEVEFAKRPTLSYSADDHADLGLDVNLGKTSEKDSPIPGKKESVAKVSVADCLACSGCITSAEAVLVTTQHSIKTFEEECSSARNERRIVFTISPASIADLTRMLSESKSGGESGAKESMNTNVDMNTTMTTDEVYRKLATFLHLKYHAEVILDGSISQRISLLESALEFCQRYQSVKSDKMQNSDSDTQRNLLVGKQKEEISTSLDNRIDIRTPSIALSANKTRFLLRTKQNSISGKEQIEAIEVKHDGGIDPRLDFMRAPFQNYPSTLAIKPRHILPMLASSCPGFVCFVEKTVKDAVPNLCTVKSPMAIAGSIFKHGLLQNIINPAAAGAINHAEKKKNMEKSVYHVSIMPCHDKKLEAERKDLAWEGFSKDHESLVPDVDLVLTSNEIWSVIITASSDEDDKDEAKLKKAQEYLRGLPLAPIKSGSNGILVTNKSYDCNDCNPIGSEVASTMKGSGSYADFIFRYASMFLFGHYIPVNQELPWKKTAVGGNRRVRSRSTRAGNMKSISDSNEVFLYRHGDGTYSCQSRDDGLDVKVLSFATAYGFKNIQLLTQRIANDEMKLNGYDFVETMACPSGCLNGGGQIHATAAASGNKARERPSEMRERVEQTRKLMDDVLPCTSKCELGAVGVSELQENLLHTRFHVVPKLELSTGATAGVAVDDTQW